MENGNEFKWKLLESLFSIQQELVDQIIEVLAFHFKAHEVVETTRQCNIGSLLKSCNAQNEVEYMLEYLFCTEGKDYSVKFFTFLLENYRYRVLEDGKVCKYLFEPFDILQKICEEIYFLTAPELYNNRIKDVAKKAKRACENILHFKMKMRVIDAHI